MQTKQQLTVLECWRITASYRVEGDRRQETARKGGQKVNRRWEAGFPRWQKVGEKRKNYATLCNIVQLRKKHKDVGANKYGWKLALKGMGSGNFEPSVPPPPS